MFSSIYDNNNNRNPLIQYAIKHAWGNPLHDQQFQIKLARVSPILGYVGNFTYMGKWRSLPTQSNFYHLFTLGGGEIGLYNLGSRNKSWVPFDRWIRASEYVEKRGVVLTFYNGQGSVYPSHYTWIMQTFNGETLVAFEKNENFLMPVEKGMYLRTYTSDLPISTINGPIDSNLSFGYASTIYYDFREYNRLIEQYQAWKKSGIGIVISMVNGFVKDVEEHKPLPGDLIEVFHDSSVEMVLRFNYSSLNDFFSERDQKRKLLLFPWLQETPRKYRYFDDCDFYVYDKVNKVGLYYHRNHQDAIRQLTHQDYSLASDYVEFLINRLIEYNKKNTTNKKDIEIIVNYRKTQWVCPLGATSSRINELYLLEDPVKITNAMIGVNSSIPEWNARNLEQSPLNHLLGSSYLSLTREKVREALGYNGCSMVLSNGPFYMPELKGSELPTEYPTPPVLSGLGYKIPASYVKTSTAYEYDINGHLLRKVNIVNQEYYLPGTNCVYVEYILGEGTSWLDATMTKTDYVLDEEYSYRVYKAPWKIGPGGDEEAVNRFWGQSWSISRDGYPLIRTEEKVDFDYKKEDPLAPGRPWDGGEIGGDWEDITDTDQYTVTNGVLHWNISMINNVGLIVTDKRHLYNELDIDHVDNSYYFSLTHLWENGGIELPILPAQLDVFINDHPVSEGIDYVTDGNRVYIISRMYFKEGRKQNIKYRANGLSGSGYIPSSELGFVSNGVIGYNGRYNVRIDRPTKMICAGRLLITNSVDWAETKGHGHNLDALEGYPYEIKHRFCSNKYVERFDNYWGFEKSRELDQRISDYLSEHVSYKPLTPPKQVRINDKYQLFSPFMSQVYNELNMNFITIPENELITDQLVNELTKHIQWLLKYDPYKLGIDENYFMVFPYSNYTTPQPITPRQLTFLDRVNKLYFNSKFNLRGYFEVTLNG